VKSIVVAAIGTMLLPGAALAADPPIVRTPIANFAVAPAKSVTRVQTYRIDVGPGGVIAPHYHPAPVVCFVTKGAFVFKIADAPESRVATGEVFMEPANAPVHYFKNASAAESAQLECAFLTGADDKTRSLKAAFRPQAQGQERRAAPPG
jgi:quercetin dioxygenase-like cupin family protein